VTMITFVSESLCRNTFPEALLPLWFGEPLSTELERIELWTGACDIVWSHTSHISYIQYDSYHIFHREGDTWRVAPTGSVPMSAEQGASLCRRQDNASSL
jgi:hypothetical protein